MIKRIGLFIIDLFGLFGFWFWFVLKYPYRTKIEAKSGELVILANGPSLKVDLTQIIDKTKQDKSDIMAINYFAFDDSFYQLKPKHYCLIDVMFFKKSTREEDASKLFEILNNKVDWELTLYIPIYYSRYFKAFSKINNNNINVVIVNNWKYMGFEKFRNTYYKWGVACPELFTVATMAIYVGVMAKYEKIRLYGFDHTFFDNIQINQENQLSSVYNHFYKEDGRAKLEPIRKIESGEIWKVSDYVLEKGLLFKSHDQLSSFANYMNVSVLNCTKNSMIDSYKREN